MEGKRLQEREYEEALDDSNELNDGGERGDTNLNADDGAKSQDDGLEDEHILNY